VEVWSRIPSEEFRNAIIELSNRGYGARSAVVGQSPSDHEIEADLFDETVVKYAARDRATGNLVGLMTTHTDPNGVVWVNPQHRDWYRRQPEALCCVSSVVVDPAYFSAGVGQALLMAGALYTDTLGGNTVRVEVDFCRHNEQIIPALIESARSRLDAELGFDSRLRWRFHSTHDWVRLVGPIEMEKEDREQALIAVSHGDPGDMFDGDQLRELASRPGSLTSEADAPSIVAIDPWRAGNEDVADLVPDVLGTDLVVLGLADSIRRTADPQSVFDAVWRMAACLGRTAVVDGPRAMFPEHEHLEILDATTFASLYFDMRDPAAAQPASAETARC
jgi:GNAT superfamily N-acetyltransferase